MSDNCNGHEVLKVELENIKEDVKEMREDRKVMMDTQQSMSNSLVRLTTLMEKNDERLTQQDKKIDDHHISINGQIEGLRTDMNKDDEHLKWYQDMFQDSFGKTLKALIIVILVLLGYKLTGADFQKLFTL